MKCECHTLSYTYMRNFKVHKYMDLVVHMYISMYPLLQIYHKQELFTEFIKLLPSSYFLYDVQYFFHYPVKIIDTNLECRFGQQLDTDQDSRLIQIAIIIRKQWISLFYLFCELQFDYIFHCKGSLHYLHPTPILSMLEPGR